MIRSHRFKYCAYDSADIKETLVDMENDKKSLGVLRSLGFESWEVVKNEEAEFIYYVTVLPPALMAHLQLTNNRTARYLPIRP